MKVPPTLDLATAQAHILCLVHWLAGVQVARNHMGLFERAHRRLLTTPYRYLPGSGPAPRMLLTGACLYGLQRAGFSLVTVAVGLFCGFWWSRIEMMRAHQRAQALATVSERASQG